MLELFVEKAAHLDHGSNIRGFIVKSSFEGLVCVLNLSTMLVNKTFIDHGVCIRRFLYESLIESLHCLLKVIIALVRITCINETLSVESESHIAVVVPAGVMLKL